ncbi:MAG TPA: phospho-N-acetylmuramoyl-pentapeptide-transferase [Candidatus Sulfotelmatobacter sp.]|nr:phospho-N-acetylmuramoyl-pentapeptide-transferase [Candidatus Sulfotelmatobacter sp.]
MIRLLEAFLVALIVVALVAPTLIARLRGLAFGQTVYELAPQTHRAKAGTPTMGGVLFLAAPLAALLFAPDRRVLALTVLVVACMAIGAVDDVASIRKQKNRGLRALPKFALTALAAVVFLAVAGPQPPVLLGIGVVPVWLWYVLSVCVVLATTHAVNLTDGLDGLASGTIVPPLIVLAVLAWRLQIGDVAAFDLATLGAVLGFLLYNRHPARVFMGDTGSLALGGALAGGAILCGAHLLLLVIGGVFAAETLSVIVQVASYKTTRRRVFRKSPLHHHFEEGGWPETRVTTSFWLASLVLSLLGFALIARTA